jgi:hypothetical protein
VLLIVYYVIFMIAGDLSAYLIGEDVDLLEKGLGCTLPE